MTTDTKEKTSQQNGSKNKIASSPKNQTAKTKTAKTKILKNNTSNSNNTIKKFRLKSNSINAITINSQATNKQIVIQDTANCATTYTDELTDQDILAMPESEYMNDIQLRFFKHKLIALEQEIIENAKKTTQSLQEQETNYIADISDRATVEEEYNLELKTRDRERKLLQKIRYSLQLIESKEYGYCLETGEKIGIKRLLVRPTATLSIIAQEKQEIIEKHFAKD